MKHPLFNRAAISVFVFLFYVSDCFSQNYFITTTNDTVTCSAINFFDTNAQGKMIDLEYVTTENKTIRLKKKDIPEISMLSQDGNLYLRMPLKLKKPDGYYRYGKRLVSGKISVDVFDDVQTSYRLKENFDGSFNAQGVMKETREGIYLRHVRLPNGSIYEVSGLKGIKALKAIRAYMFACELYEKEYNSNPKYQSCSFEEAVSDYNEMCP
jgi:hypothetical protein